MGEFFMEQLSLFDFLIKKEKKVSILLKPLKQEELKVAMAKAIKTVYKKGGYKNGTKKNA